MAIYNREDPRTALPQLEKMFGVKLDELARQIDDRINELSAETEEQFDGIEPYILNSKETFASTPPIYFKEYDSGMKALGAQDTTTVDASVTPPSGYIGYIIRVRIQNGTGGANASGCNPFDYYFNDTTTVRALVRNNFTAQANVHVLFTVMWTNRNLVGSL